MSSEGSQKSRRENINHEYIRRTTVGSCSKTESSLATGMEFTRQYLPLEWEERWRKEKERRKRVIEDGGEEGIEQDNRELRRIVAYNDSRMGLMSGRGNKEGSKVRMSGPSREGIGERMSEEAFGDEGLVHMYRSETYPKEVFKALKEFWDSSLLTDLTLTTYNETSFQVHSPILAAVSSFIRERLRDESAEQSDNNKDVEVQRRSVSLGPEIDHVGLQAVVEFAYTGAVLSLNKDSMALIKAAAQALGVPRILDLCHKEEMMKEVGCPKREEPTILSLEQMKVTLQSIKHLWVDRVGCDVILDVDGASFNG